MSSLLLAPSSKIGWLCKKILPFKSGGNSSWSLDVRWTLDSQPFNGAAGCRWRCKLLLNQAFAGAKQELPTFQVPTIDISGHPQGTQLLLDEGHIDQFQLAGRPDKPEWHQKRLVLQLFEVRHNFRALEKIFADKESVFDFIRL